MTGVELCLVRPGPEHLPAYADALQRGWFPDNVRGPPAAAAQLDRIARDAAGFLNSLDDPEGRAPPHELPDGTLVQRLPGIIRWIWTDTFCGSIGLRWQAGTADLPPHVLGHIGFTIVPWRRREGLATRALALMLEEARRRGLPSVEITTTPDNLASQRVIETNGGVLVERFEKIAAYGGGEALRYRIPL